MCCRLSQELENEPTRPAVTNSRQTDWPYLKGIEYPSIKNRATRVLALVSGQIEMVQPYTLTPPLMKHINAQAPQAICELVPQNISRDLLIDRTKQPFDDRDGGGRWRSARTAKLCRHPGGRSGRYRRRYDPAARRAVGHAPGVVETLPGYGLDVQKNRAEARQIMQAHGYGPGRRLAIKVSTRNTAAAVNATVVLVDQFKEIYIYAELEPIDNALWFAKVMRHDYTVASGNTFERIGERIRVRFDFSLRVLR